MHFQQIYQTAKSFEGIVKFEKEHGYKKTLSFYDGFCKGEPNRKRKLNNFLRDHEILFGSRHEYMHDADNTNMAEMALKHGSKVALRIYGDFWPGCKNRSRKLSSIINTVKLVSPHEHIISNALAFGNKKALKYHKRFHAGDKNRDRKLSGLLNKIQENETVEATHLYEGSDDKIYFSPFGSPRSKRNGTNSSLTMVSSTHPIDSAENMDNDSSGFNLMDCLT